MAGRLGMLFISAVGVNQDLCQCRTAVMGAGVGRADQGLFILPQFLSRNTQTMAMMGAYFLSYLSHSPVRYMNCKTEHTRIPISINFVMGFSLLVKNVCCSAHILVPAH